MTFFCSVVSGLPSASSVRTALYCLCAWPRGSFDALLSLVLLSLLLARVLTNDRYYTLIQPDTIVEKR